MFVETIEFRISHFLLFTRLLSWLRKTTELLEDWFKINKTTKALVLT